MQYQLFITLILFFISACSGIQTHSDYLKGKDLYKNKQYMQASFFVKKAVDKAPDNIKYSILLAWAYLKQGNTRQAKQAILPFETKSPENIQIIQVKAWIEYTLGKHELATQWFQKAIQWANHPNQKKIKDQLYIQSIKSDAFYGLGLIDIQKQKFEQARKNYQRALQYQNQFIGHKTIKIAYADTFYQNRKYVDAQREYEKIQFESDIEIQVKMAWCMYFTKKYIDAEIFLLKNLYRTQDKRSVLYALIFTTFAQKKYTQANNYLSKLIDIDPSFADTNDIWQLIQISKDFQEVPFTLAKQYYKRGNFRRASALIKSAIGNQINDCSIKQIDIWCELYQSQALIALSQFNQMIVNKSCDPMQGILGQGISLLYLGYYSDAKTAFQKISQDSQYYLRSQMALAAIDYLNGNFENAISIYSENADKLIENKDVFWTFLNMNTFGWSYIYKQDFKKAEKIFTNLNDIPNQMSGIHLFGLAWAKYQQGKVDEAVSDLINNQLSHYDNFKQSMLLANAFYLKEDYKSAIEIYEENMQFIPDKELFFSWGSYALQNLGWSYIHTKQYSKALQTFQRLKDYHAAPIYFSINENLGWGFYYMGMIENSQAAFNSAIKIYPNSQLARKGLKQILKYRNRSHQ
ncbi:hypothetical protein MHK_003757 [Candidatus Magnetomorum sp. HK-1]|nr:hypothetical protein MHK_003757 [Candidatus Magnetomorum sp. HK-1]